MNDSSGKRSNKGTKMKEGEVLFAKAGFELILCKSEFWSVALVQCLPVYFKRETIIKLWHRFEAKQLLTVL